MNVLRLRTIRQITFDQFLELVNTAQVNPGAIVCREGVTRRQSTLQSIDESCWGIRIVSNSVPINTRPADGDVGGLMKCNIGANIVVRILKLKC